MNIIYLLLPAALLLVLVFVGLFLWAAKTDQYEDLDTPAKRILLDDVPPKSTNANNSSHIEDEV
jgi:cbb3-type cytochrome oxidase maturation protein